ncbi:MULTISPECIES: phage holin family protein [Arthrobacter]|uniref:Phage holin family protein n=1 Tax=Arthrobacter jinronghuae TaxID=2964609 RepID=A0ABT1NT89_9MICC|nr:MULTISPECIES: phage holin family protein [Arthrobacter]MCC9175319.1 phage holin family protein [Arthrobacter sp. zg-Y179]MCQ1950948.1 phage holin family protein [Arthrobacter jinronghuae]MCQ1954261.1 phage holin family protein [Arthrobacter sp. zg-Y238]MCQ1957137.1 phage holin family protein [Arthrobacter jinronghuae]UWX79412.1 phage holin family protein [Arthrobacter jinronghuae]
MSTELPPTPAQAKAESTSLGDLLGQVTQDMSTLMRQEVELAKVELKQSATRAGTGAGMFAGAAVAGYFVLLFLSIALWYALGTTAIGFGWSAVIVAVLWAIVAAVLASRGRKEMKKIKGMPQTSETLQEIPQTMKPSEETR